MKAARAEEVEAGAGEGGGEAEELVPAEVDAELLQQMEGMVGGPARLRGGGGARALAGRPPS